MIDCAQNSDRILHSGCRLFARIGGFLCNTGRENVNIRLLIFSTAIFTKILCIFATLLRSLLLLLR